MSETDLAAIRARIAAATPGPWYAFGNYLTAETGHCTCSPHYGAHERGCGLMDIGQVQEPDADLIAHAPADLAALCDEVDRLRAAVERVRAVALGEDTEEWVRRVGMSCLVSSASVLEALDGAE